MQRKNIYDQVYSHQDLIERCGGKKVPMATAFLVQNPSRADTMWKFNDIHVMSPWKHMKTPWNSEMSPVSATLGSSYARSVRGSWRTWSRNWKSRQLRHEETMLMSTRMGLWPIFDDIWGSGIYKKQPQSTTNTKDMIMTDIFGDRGSIKNNHSSTKKKWPVLGMGLARQLATGSSDSLPCNSDPVRPTVFQPVSQLKILRKWDASCWSGDLSLTAKLSVEIHQHSFGGLCRL